MAATQLIAQAEQRKPLTALVYALAFLFITTALYISLSFQYDRHLIHTGQFGWLRTIHEYSALAEALFYTFQLLVVLLLFRPFASIIGRARENGESEPDNLKGVCLGILGGILALAAGALSLLGHNGSQELGAFLVDHAYNASGILLAFVLILVLPILSEAFFRGVVLRRLLQTMSLPAAVVIAALVFTFFWSTFTFIPCLALGVVSGILFCRMKSLLPCIIANSVFTIGAMALLMWRSL